MYRPLDLDNFSRRDIPRFVKFHGWHAFRRGLGNRLYEIGMRDSNIQGDTSSRRCVHDESLLQQAERAAHAGDDGEICKGRTHEVRYKMNGAGA